MPSSPIQRAEASSSYVSFSSLSWFMNKGYAQGAFWVILICLFSNLNDILMKGLGERLPTFEIIFFRFFFSLITLLPFMIREGFSSLRMKHPSLHGLRAIIGIVAIGASCLSVTKLPLADVTTLFFTQPLFFLPLALLLLKERVPYQRALATLVGFIGVLIIIQPHPSTVNLWSLVPIFGAFLFAVLDVLTKKMISQESYLSLLFSFSLGTTLAGLIPAFFVWVTPTSQELFFLFCLGAGANLIQICLFQAFSSIQASALAPFRYVELIFSVCFGFLLFAEVPHLMTLLGAILIIMGTLLNTYQELRTNPFLWLKKNPKKTA